MRFGLFSDVHSNLEAFERVLEALKKEQVEKYVFTGDIVGYGASPRECLELLRQLKETQDLNWVAGNHDYAVCQLTRYDHFASHAKEAVDWTKKVLDRKDIEYLTRMPLVERVAASFIITHANLELPQEWGYIFDAEDASSSFDALTDQICFIGHTHQPVVFTKCKTVEASIRSEIVIRKDAQYIINLGSVGQPRDGNPQATYGVYDSEAGRVEIKRISYDIKKAQEKIIKAGLPRILADRLSFGK